MNNDVQKQIEKFDELQWEKLVKWREYSNLSFSPPLIPIFGKLRMKIFQRTKLSKKSKLENIGQLDEWSINHKEAFSKAVLNSELFWSISIEKGNWTTEISILRSIYDDLLPYLITIDHTHSDTTTERLYINESLRLQWKYVPCKLFDFDPEYKAEIDLSMTHIKGWHIVQGKECNINKYRPITENGFFLPNINDILCKIVEAIPSRTPKGVIVSKKIRNEVF